MDSELHASIAGERFRFVGAGGHARRELELRFARFACTSATREPFTIHIEDAPGEARIDGPVELACVDGDIQLALGAGRAFVGASAARIQARHAGPLIDSVVRLALGDRLARRGGMLVHASAVEVGEGVHVFVGPSGAGKSTLFAHLRGRRFSDEAAALVPTPVGIEVHATPYWHGEPASGPLARLHFIERGVKPGELELRPAEVAARLCAASGPWAPQRESLVLACGAAIARSSPRAGRLVLSSIDDIGTWLQPRLDRREAA